MWINLIMDAFCALALQLEKSDKYLIEETENADGSKTNAVAYKKDKRIATP
jgi:magnesium-transporting ATPase (P-type)